MQQILFVPGIFVLFLRASFTETRDKRIISIGPTFLWPDSSSIWCNKVDFKILRPEPLPILQRMSSMTVLVDGLVVFQKDIIEWEDYVWSSSMRSGAHVAELFVQEGPDHVFTYGHWISFYVSSGYLTVTKSR